MTGTYDSLDIHRLMLRDEIRNQAYRRALAATVKPGDVVLDFGAGTGILSLFAAQAGAARVFAVERTSIAGVARKLIENNGYADRIRVIQADGEAVRLPARVDVIVSEWLGTLGVDENLLAPLLLLRDRWLKPGGKMLPSTVTAWLAPHWNREIAAETGLWHGSAYGLDLSLLADNSMGEMFWAKQAIAPEDLIARPQPLWTTDTNSFSAAQARLPFRANLAFAAERAGRINALTAWFSADFGQGVTLTNAPGAPKTHWAQYVFPLNQAVQVGPGTPIRVEFLCLPVAQGFCALAWSAKVADGPWEHHDTRQIRQLA